ncbi:hypothetical protein J6TS7_00540 [Paenibacillus dendritiformis]|nr:hypothetical protein J6TS7_00540 [Paenibacillus dendritiformis]
MRILICNQAKKVRLGRKKYRDRYTQGQGGLPEGGFALLRFIRLSRVRKGGGLSGLGEDRFLFLPSSFGYTGEDEET